MNEKKILIFEDEWNTIKGSFELANIYAFDKSLKFTVVSKSQDVSFSSWNSRYDAVFIDITLAKNTILDGFNIITEIVERDLFPLDKIIVLSGNSKVKEKLIEMGIDTKAIKVLYKPIDFEMLAKVLERVL